MERFFPCRASLWSESKSYDCHLSSNTNDVGVIHQVVSDRKLEFDIDIGSEYSSSLGEYIVCGNCNNRQLFTVIFAYAYEEVLIGGSYANLYTDFDVNFTHPNNNRVHVVISANQITSEMDFNIKCVRITPLR